MFFKINNRIGIKSFIYGYGSTIDLSSSHSLIFLVNKKKYSGFKRDSCNLKKDWNRIGQDIAIAIHKQTK